MKFLKEYWFLVIFVIGLITAGVTLKVKAEQTAEKVVKVEAKVEEQEKVDTQQTVALAEISATQKYIVETLKALNEEIKK